MADLADFAGKTAVAPRISMVNGVAQVQVSGGTKYAVRVQLDPDKLVAARRSASTKSPTRINNWNPNSPPGPCSGAEAYTLKLNGELHDAEGFGNLIVAWRNGSAVRLADVADVVNSVENDMNAAWMYNGGKMKRAVQMQVMKQPGANTIEVADAVKALFTHLQSSSCRRPCDLTTRGDRSDTIRASFRRHSDDHGHHHDLLVVVVIFVFLRSALAATIIPAMALPFSLLGTVASDEAAWASA